MKITIRKSYDDLSRATADFIRAFVQQKPTACLCFPSGETPTGTFQYLVAYAQAGQVDFSRCTFVGLDEWVGLDATDEGSGRHYLDHHFFTPLGISPEKIQFFDGRAADLAAECQRINAYIAQHGPLDLMLVGVGLNGHIGLNEPGVAFDLYAHRIALAESTKTAGQKYFSQATDLQEGITLGIKHVREAKTVVLFAAGAKKAAIVAQALTGPVTNQVPASILQTHPDAYVFLDVEAATGLPPTTPVAKGDSSI